MDMPKPHLNEGVIPLTKPLESDDPGKWEMDTEPWVDRIYHELLGEIHNPQTGEYSRDQRRKRQMNERGASEFISEISSRVSIHMQMSVLTDEDIKEMASRASEIFSEKLEDNWLAWDITPTQSNFESICQRLFDALYILLMIAKQGGMREHRERKGRPLPVPHSEEGGLF